MHNVELQQFFPLSVFTFTMPFFFISWSSWHWTSC